MQRSFLPFTLLALAACSSNEPRSAAPVQRVSELPAADAALTNAQLLRPRHSPDGALIACFAREGAQPSDEYPYEGYQLLVVPAAGGMPAQLGSQEYRAVTMSAPSWSPDGARLVVVRWDMRAGGPIEFELHELDRGRATVLAVADDGASVHSPAAWSPDGALVALTWEQTDAALVRVQRLDGRGRASARIADPRDGWPSAAFDPDGKRLAVLARNQLVLFDTSTPPSGDENTLRKLAALEVPFANSEASAPPLFLPGSQRIACLAGHALWIANLATGAVEPAFAGRRVIDLVLAPGGAELAALLEDKFDPRGLVGTVEVLAGAGHAPKRYQRSVTLRDLASGAERELHREARPSSRPDFLAELDLDPRTLQAFSRWR